MAAKVYQRAPALPRFFFSWTHLGATLEQFGPREKELARQRINLWCAMRENNWKLVLIIMVTSAVLMSASYTMIIPFLPMYLMEEMGVSKADVNWWSGLVFSISFLISGIMAPIWGALADKKSRKLMAVRSAAFLCIAYFATGIVQTPWQLFLARMLQGFAAGLWPACLSILSSQVPQNRLGFCLGSMQAGSTAGAVLGPMVGGILAQIFGMRAACYIAAAALLVITILILVYIKEPPHRVPVASALKVKRPSLLKNKAIVNLLIAACVGSFSMLMVQPVLPLYIADLQGSMDRIVLISGVVFSVVGFSGVIASPVWGIVGQNWGYRNTLYLALLLSGILNIVQALPETLTGFTIWRFIAGLAFAGIYPAINSMFAQYTDPADRGKIFGWSFSVQQFGNVIGPIAGGMIATCWSNQMAVMMSGAVLLPLLVWLYIARNREHVEGGSGQPIIHQDDTAKEDA